MKKALRLNIAFCLLLLSCSAQAQLCNASSVPVAFGLYDPKSSAPVESTGSVTVTCQGVVSLLIFYSIDVSAGISGNVSQRKMTNGTVTMDYQLYMDTARTLVWGNGTGGSQHVTDGYLLQLLLPNVKTYTVYGRIPGLQNVYAGAYTDTPTVLLTF